MPSVRVGPVSAMVMLAGLLAGCSDPEPFPEPVFEEYVDPHGDIFADSRHCYAYNVHTFVLAADLVPLVPSGWSFSNPLAPEVRVVLHRCIEDFALLVTVPMRAGGPADVAATQADFVVEVFTDSTDDDWTRMGAPVHPATVTLEPLAGGEESWRITAAGGWAILVLVQEKGDPGSGRSETREYGAGTELVRSWAEEQAALTRPVTATVEFGPGSALEEVRDIPVALPKELAEASPNHWWGAFNAEYRLGTAP